MREWLQCKTVTFRTKKEQKTISKNKWANLTAKNALLH